MSARVAIIAALPREVAGLVRGVSPDRDLLRRGIHLHRLENAVVVAAGMGAARASLAVEAAFASGVVSGLISVGLAGSCAPELREGTVVEAREVVDVNTGERFTGEGEEWVLVTADSIASVQEKARLRGAYIAGLVDMEAATVARLAVAHGVWFRAIKGISDGHDFELASLALFAAADGQFRTAAFAFHTAVRPHTWGPAVNLGRNSNRALAALHRRLEGVLAGG